MSGFADGIRVLHVDDERSFAELSAEFVERESDRIEVEVATSPDEALARLAEEPFDCIVSDHEMPDRNGIEFLEAVRERYPDLPFVLFTGKGSEEVASEAISAGVTDYLQKEPGTSQYEVLANRVENAVEQRRTREAVAETEQRLQTIAENTNEVLWKFSGDWNELLFVNSSYEEVWGQSVAELRERPQSFLDGIHPEDRDHVREAMGELSAGHSVDIEYRVNAAEDFGRWVWVQGEPVFGPDGETVEKVVGFARDITERKERELAHEREQRRYAALFEHTHDATAWVAFENGTPIIREVNPAFRELFGEPGEELAGRDIDEVVASAERREEAREISRKLMDGQTLSGELTRDTVDGPREFLWHAVPVEDPESGEVESGFAVYTDITERNRAEQRLEALLEHTSDVVAVVSEDGTIRYESPAIERVLGYEPSELIGEDVFEYIHPDDREYAATEFASAIEEPDTITRRVEYRWQHGDGSWVWVESVGVNKSDSVLDGYVVTTREISERKERERELERYEAMIRASGDPMYTLDTEGRFTSVNDALVEMSGYDESTLLGSHARTVMVEEDLARGRELIESLLSGGADRGTFEMNLVTADGERVACENHVAILPFESEPRGTVGVLRDVTDRLERQRQLERERDRLDEFASVLSHDLRNPLNVVEGHLDLLATDHDSKHVEAAVEAVERIEELVSDLLTMARQGQDIGPLEPVALRTFAGQCWENVETPGATLEVEADGTIRADRSRLAQLFENLFRNAVEHGGESVTITVGTLEDGFYVADDGPGIPAAERDAVFETGYSTGESGTGFGLSIVAGIVEGHGWEIAIAESEAGGTRFEITGLEVA